MRKHQDLEVWKKSVGLVTKVYEITKTFPKDEIYGITNQIRRAAVSIPSNIAEGAGRNHDKEFVQFLYVSMGSCSELETQLLICKNIKYLTDENLEDIMKDLIEVRMMISGLVRAVNRGQETGDRGQETGDRRQVTGDRGQGIGDRGQGIGNREQGTGDSKSS